MEGLSEEVVNFSIDVLIGSLKVTTNDEIMNEILWGISYLTQSHLFVFQKLIESNILSLLIQNLSDINRVIIAPCLRIVSDFSTTENVSEYLLTNEFLDITKNYLASSYDNKKKLIIFTLSNIAAENEQAAMTLIDQGFINILIHGFNGSHLHIQKEIIFLIGNTLMFNSIQIIKKLEDKGVYNTLVQGLFIFKDNKSLIVILE